MVYDLAIRCLHWIASERVVVQRTSSASTKHTRSMGASIRPPVRGRPDAADDALSGHISCALAPVLYVYLCAIDSALSVVTVGSDVSCVHVHS